MARDEAELLAMGQRIEQLRDAHGFKQQWIADQIGVKLRTYQFWQAGESKPEQENLEKLAALFKVTPRYILKGVTPDLSMQNGDPALKEIDEKLDRILEMLRNRESVEDVVARALGPLLELVESLQPPTEHEAQTPLADEQHSSASS